MKFSVTIPAFKAAYLEEAINSILKQTYQDYEIIIVDDCSPEDLKSVVNKFSDSRIHYYRNEKNCGAENVVDNWNICLSYCTGDYVICMGDDDRLMPNCLEEYALLIDKYPNAQVYHAKTIIIDEHGRGYKLQESRPEWESALEMTYNQFAWKRIQFIGDFCFSRSWLNANNGYEEFPFAFYSDWATANKAALSGGIVNGQKFMFEYREHNRTISRNGYAISRTLLRASQLVRKWYDDFVAQIQYDETDSLYRECLGDILKDRFDKEIIIMIGRDIVYSSFSVKTLFYWLRHSREYKLNYVKILRIYLYHLRNS